jgi:fluoride exporter
LPLLPSLCLREKPSPKILIPISISISKILPSPKIRVPSVFHLWLNTSPAPAWLNSPHTYLGAMIRVYLLVGLGSFLGGVTRFWLSGWIASRWGESFPWGTLAVNVTGSLVIGILVGFSDAGRMLLAPETRQFLLIGILGGFTTFSSFSLQTLRLLQDEQWLYAGGNVISSFFLCLLAVFAGYKVAEGIS